MNLRLLTPSHLVDLGGACDELNYVRRDDGHLAVGAMTRMSAVEASAEAVRSVPLLVEAVRHVAHPPIRHRGTVVGSIAHGALVAELPCVALILDAELTLLSVGGTRTVRAGEFFLGPFRTCAAADEVVTQVRFPVISPRTGHAWSEFTPRHGNFPFAGAGASVTLDGEKIIAASIGMCGVSDRPVRAAATEALLVGARATPETIAAAAAMAAEGIQPRPDNDPDAHIVPVKVAPTANWAYRIAVARVQVRRAITTAVERARDSS